MRRFSERSSEEFFCIVQGGCHPGEVSTGVFWGRFQGKVSGGGFRERIGEVSGGGLGEVSGEGLGGSFRGRSKKEVSRNIFLINTMLLFFPTSVTILNLPVAQNNRQNSLIQVFLVLSLDFNRKRQMFF